MIEEKRREEKRRIEFIDLAKGVCIILVVMGHCFIPHNIPGMQIVRMPLYFILSGLFFKTYGGLFDFCIKKTNKILIPFLFFFLTGVILDNILGYITHQDVFSIYDAVFNREMFNRPIWFLLSLFWSNLIFATIFQFVKNDITRIILVVLLGCIGYILGQNDIILPLYADSSLVAMPFFCFGYYLKQTSILYENKYDKFNIIIVLALYALCVLLSNIGTLRFALVENSVNGNPLVIYSLGILSAMTLILCCKIFKSIPVVSYMGRYSIIILCTHWVIIKVLIRLPFAIVEKPWVLTLLTLLGSLIMIPICKKIIPWFVAQRDLIKIK